MPDYLIYFNQQWVGDHSEDWFRSREKPSNAVVDEMKAAGVYVYAAGVEVSGPVYAADASSGEVVVTDGPYAETKEYLAGFDLLECGSLEEALEIAGRHPVAHFGSIEVRAFAQ